MGDWKRIGCGIDFSEISRAALDTAAGLAGRFGAELYVVHVHAAEHAEPASPLAPPPVHAARAPGHGSPLLEWTRAVEARAGGLATSIELSGRPAEALARFAREFKCDLLVVGTHGRTGLRHAALGSVAEALVRVAPCPVLVVRGAAERAGG